MGRGVGHNDLSLPFGVRQVLIPLGNVLRLDKLLVVNEGDVFDSKNLDLVIFSCPCGIAGGCGGFVCCQDTLILQEFHDRQRRLKYVRHKLSDLMLRQDNGEEFRGGYPRILPLDAFIFGELLHDGLNSRDVGVKSYFSLRFCFVDQGLICIRRRSH